MVDVVCKANFWWRGKKLKNSVRTNEDCVTMKVQKDIFEDRTLEMSDAS